MRDYKELLRQVKRLTNAGDIEGSKLASSKLLYAANYVVDSSFLGTIFLYNPNFPLDPYQPFIANPISAYRVNKAERIYARLLRS